MAHSSPSLWRPFVWSLVMLFLVLVAPYLFLMLLNSGSFPPRWYERRAQRQKVAERVQAAGGWEALRKECIAFARTNEMVHWTRWHTNGSPALPPVMKALQPQQVYYIAPKLLGPRSGESQIPTVSIKVFGMHASVGHSTPYFGFEVVATSASTDYAPKAHPAVSGNGHMNYQKVSEGVYETF